MEWSCQKSICIMTWGRRREDFFEATWQRDIASSVLHRDLKPNPNAYAFQLSNTLREYLNIIFSIYCCRQKLWMVAHLPNFSWGFPIFCICQTNSSWMICTTSYKQKKERVLYSFILLMLLAFIAIIFWGTTNPPSLLLIVDSQQHFCINEEEALLASSLFLWM